jgi:hypothetical protein
MLLAALCSALRPPALFELSLRSCLRIDGKIFELGPGLYFLCSQPGVAPRPAHVFPERSRYLAGTFRPFNELPHCFRLGPISSPSRESCLVNSFALRRRATVTSVRSCKRLSTDMLARLGLAMLSSGKGHHTHNILFNEVSSAPIHIRPQDPRL